MNNKILLIDNYDSFTYNLVHLLQQHTSANIEVHLNNKINLKKIKNYSKIVLSPGPGLPHESGNLLPIIEQNIGKIPILGVCLGHQAIAQVLGYKLKNLQQVFHGVQSKINIIDNEDLLLKNLPQPFSAGRYHSWVVENKSAAKNNLFKVSCIDNNNSIMAMYNNNLFIYGVQFHPESIMTNIGETIIKNFLAL